jgi:hypothetical protein
VYVVRRAATGIWHCSCPGPRCPTSAGIGVRRLALLHEEAVHPTGRRARESSTCSNRLTTLIRTHMPAGRIVSLWPASSITEDEVTESRGKYRGNQSRTSRCSRRRPRCWFVMSLRLRAAAAAEVCRSTGTIPYSHTPLCIPEKSTPSRISADLGATLARSGPLDLRAQAEAPSARRTHTPRAMSDVPGPDETEWGLGTAQLPACLPFGRALLVPSQMSREMRHPNLSRLSQRPDRVAPRAMRASLVLLPHQVLPGLGTRTFE